MPHRKCLGIAELGTPNKNQVIETACYSNSVVQIEFENGHKFGVLLDTGAVTSCISLPTLKRILPSFKLQRYKGPRLTNASDHDMTPLGWIELKFVIAGHLSCDRMLVFPSLNQHIILGRTWILKYKAEINLSQQRLKFEPIPLIATETHKLEPGEVCLIQATINNDCFPSLPHGLHGMTVFHEQVNKICALESAVTIGDNCTPILLQNKGTRKVTVKKGDFLANFSPLSAEDMPIDSPSHSQSSNINSTSNEHKQDQTYFPFDLSKCDCSESDKDDIKTILKDHINAFIGPDGKIGLSKLEPYEITLKPDFKPLCRQPYRIAHDLRDSVRQQIDLLLDQKIIEPGKNLMMCSPLIAVRKNVKKSRKHMNESHTPSPSSVRIVVDMRYVNSQCLYPKHEIVSLTSILDVLAEAKAQVYSILDMKHGYLQIGLSDESKPVTGFLYEGQAYQFTRLTQGLSGSPMAFMQRLTTLFRDYMNKFMTIYLDDILIFSDSMDSHKEHLAKVLSRIEQYNLKLSPSKCTFATHRAHYLGHIICSSGISPSDDHIRAIKAMPEPENVEELRSRLGLYNFFHSFIPNRAKLMAPLTHLCKKGIPWDWTKECSQNFQALKQALASQPLLRHADFNKPFYVMTDASKVAISGCLLQVCEKTKKFVPISFASRSTTACEKVRSVYENELLAVIFSITSFSYYLTGHHFVLYCDNAAVNHLLKNCVKLSPKLARWSLYLSNFSFSVKYIKSGDNKVADALSRTKYEFDRTKADDKFDEFPHIPGIDNVFCSQSCNAQSHSGDRKSLLHDNSFDIENDSDFEDGSISAVTRAQAANEREKQIEINRQLILDNLPYANATDSDIASHDGLDNDTEKEKQKLRNARLKCAKLPKRIALDNENLEKAVDKSDTIWLFNMSANDIRKAQLADHFTGDLIRFLENNILPPTARRLRKCIVREMDYMCGNDGCLYQIWSPRYHQGDITLRLVIPKGMQKRVLSLTHKNILMHAGVMKTIDYLRNRCTWAGLHMDVRRFIGNCDTCLLAKNNQKLEQAERTLFTSAQRPLDMVSVDFVGPIGVSERGYNHICTTVEYFSGFVLAWPVKDVSSKTFATTFYEKFICLFGTPKIILSDRGSAFIANVWRNLSEIMGIKLVYTAGFKSSTNGMCEKMNASLTNLVRCMASKNPKTWCKYVAPCCYALNSTVNSGHGQSAYSILFGRSAPSILDNTKCGNLDPARMTDVVEEILKGQEIAQEMAAKKFQANCEKMKHLHDKKIKQSKLCAGDVVFYKRPNLGEQTGHKKLKITMYGPCVVLRVYDNNTADIKHLHTGEIFRHRVSVTQLKRAMHYVKTDDQSEALFKPLLQTPKQQ